MDVPGHEDIHPVLEAGTAHIVEEDGVMVATGEGEIDDETVLALIDAGRRWPRDET